MQKQNCYIYIKIGRASDYSWRHASEIIKYCIDLRSSHPKYSQSHFISKDISIYSRLSVSPPQKRVIGNSWGKKIALTDLIASRSFSQLQNIYFVIVVNFNESIGFDALIPFLALRNKYNNVTLCLDLSNIVNNSKELDSQKFRFAHFFAPYIEANDKVPFSVCVLNDKNTLRCRKIPSHKDFIPGRRSPLIFLNKSTIEDIFFKKEPDILSASCQKNESSYYGDSIPYILVSCHAILKKNNPGLYDKIEKEFRNSPLITLYIFSLLIDLHTERKSKKRKSSIADSTISKYSFLAKRFSSGIYEIVENIFFHTQKKEGYIYFSLNKTSKLNFSFPVDSIAVQEKNEYQNFIKNTDPWGLKIIIRDYNEEGILETFQKSKTNDINISLSDFFIGTFSQSDNMIQLDLRVMAHLGLKVFSALTLDQGGFFRVETGSRKDKKELIISKSISQPNNCREQDKLSPNHCLNGTVFQIIFPVKESTSKYINPSPLSLERKSCLDLLRAWIRKDEVTLAPEIISLPELESFHLGDYANTQKYLEKIIDTLASEFKVRSNENNIIALDVAQLLGASISIPRIIKICAGLQLREDRILIKYVVLYNVDDASFDFLYNSLHVLAQTQKLWSDFTYLYIYDKKGIPFIIHGNDPELCNKINQQVGLYYGSYTELKVNANNSYSSYENDKIDTSILPFDLFIRIDHNNPDSITLFEQATSKILENPIEEATSLGVLVKKSHMRLGSKIHIRNFYEAEALFQHSFYAERFAFLLARDLIDTLPVEHGKMIILLGYGQYSEMILNRMKNLLVNDNSENPKLTVAYYTCSDLVSMKWPGVERFDTGEENLEAQFVIIVPIGSTLTTPYKITKSFCRCLQNKNVEFDENRLHEHILKNSHNYCVVLVRDKSNGNQPTTLEARYGWTSIDRRKRIVKTEPFHRGTKFLILKDGYWTHPLYCKDCFPDYESSLANLQEEIFLSKTGHTSLTTRDVLDWPDSHCDLSFNDLQGRINRLESSLKQGHLIRNKTHYSYYVDTLRFFDDHRSDIEKWLFYYKREDTFSISKFNIIFTPSHNTNMGFVHLVNETIFNGTSTIIRFNLKEEWDENFIIKYSYLSNFGNELALHFIDDAILSGKTYFRTNRIISSINSTFSFSNVFVLLSRLSQIAFEDFLSSYPRPGKIKPVLRSYLELPLPLIRSLISDCPLCAQKDFIKRLSVFPMLDRSKAEFMRNSTLLEKSKAETHEYCSSKHFLRFKAINEIYWRLSHADKIDKKKIITNYFNTGKDIDKKDFFIRKTNMLKGLFSSNIINYKEIKKILLDLIIKESTEILSDKSTRANPDIAHFNWIRTLLSSSISLDSTFFLRKKIILNLWELYDNFSAKYFLKFEKIRKNDIEDLMSLISQQEKIARKRKDVKAGPLFASQWRIYLNKLESEYEDIYNKINKKISKEEIDLVSKALEKIISELHEPDANDINKLIHNFFSFATFYAMNIKKSVYLDDSKSTWIEYLLRQGNELELSVDRYIDFTNANNIAYNDLYKFKNELKNDHAKKTYSSFLVASFIDNTGIIYTAFKSLDKENVRKEICNSIHKDNDLSRDSEGIFTLFNETLQNNYYYSNMLFFIKGVSGSHSLEKIFLIYKLYSFLYMIDGDLNKNDMSLHDNQLKLGIKKEMHIIIKALALFFNAEKACIAVNPYHGSPNKRRLDSGTSGYIDNSYVVAVYNDVDLENSIPVAMDGRDEPFEFLEYISYQDDTLFSRENWYTFFTLEPRRKDSWEGAQNGKLFCVIRFFTPENSTNTESVINPPAILGAACFVFPDIDDLEQKKVLLKELIRLMLLVKDLLQNYLQNNFLNDNFRRWINKAEQLHVFEQRLDKHQHGAQKQLGNLIEAVRNTEDLVAISWAWVISTNIFIGDCYARISQGTGLSFTDPTPSSYRSFFKANPNGAWLFQAEKIFKHISKLNIESNKSTIEVKINDKYIKKSIPRDMFRILIALILNATRYSKKGRCTNILIEADEYGISVINDNLNDNCYKIQNNINKILKLKKPGSGLGITLFTICRYMQKYGTGVEVECYGDKLCIILPLFP